MTAPLDFWSLPGPRVFAETTWDALRGGRSVVAHMPSRGVPELSQPVVEHARRDGYDSIRIDGTEADAEAGVARAAGMYDAWQLSGRSLAQMHELMVPTLYVAFAEVGHWASWKRFLEEFARHAHNVDEHTRPRFLILSRDSDRRTDGEIGDGQIVVGQVWSGVLGYFDTAVYTWGRLASSSLLPLRIRLLTTMVTELAKWDLDLAEALIGADVATVWNPVELLRSYATAKGWTPDREPSWSDGTIEAFEGRFERHSAWLAIAGLEEVLRSRLWSAQVSVIMPIIERERIRLAEDAAPILRSVSTSDDRRLLDLEIGPLCDALFEAQVPKSIKYRARTLRNLRNCLAHREVIPYENLWHSRLITGDSPATVA